MRARKLFTAAALSLTFGAATAVALPAVATARSSAPVIRSTAAMTSSTRPPGREWPSFAYDPALHQLVLFGGDNGRTSLGDTWTRTNGIWTRQHPAQSPSPRTGAAIVYDAATSQLLLFGGSRLLFTRGGFYGDTWIWTGRDWRQLHPVSSPPARHNADMIYDAATQNVVLFGGYDGHYLNDTWTWNGTNWSQMHPAAAPAPRDTGAFVFDAATGTGVLFSGFNETGQLLDTWTWNGTTWTRQHPATSPDSRTGWMAGYDAVTQRVIIFSQQRAQATWAWNGTTWTHLFPSTAPPARSNGAATDNTAINKIVLFGGVSDVGRPILFNTAWAWNGITWQFAG